MDLYAFAEGLTLPEGAVVVTDAGSAFYLAPVLKLREGMRYITDGAQGAMGACLPMCIGAAFAFPKRQIIGITVDGSFAMQVQHAPTVIEHGLNIKLYVLKNGGYVSIKNTQDKFCEGRQVGVEPRMFFPEFPFIEYVDVDPTRIRRPF